MVDLLSSPSEIHSDPMSTTKAPGPRERLLASARRLTGAHGVGVGIDAILEDASVARRSLYQHFAGKDDLIAQSLLDSADKDEARYWIALERGGDDPRQRVLAVLDQLDPHHLVARLPRLPLHLGRTGAGRSSPSRPPRHPGIHDAAARPLRDGAHQHGTPRSRRGR